MKQEMKKNISQPEQKEILLGLMDAIHSFCEEKSIRYFLTGGTLLGAVRHKGFIPWDDDIDIVMLRDDYNRFIQEFNNDRKDFVSLVCFENTKNFYLPYAKVVDNRTVLKEDVFKPIPIGVSVDVFPLDDMSNNLDEAKSFYKKQKKYIDLLTLKNVNLNKKRSFLKNFLLLISKFLVPRNLVIKKLLKNAESFSTSADAAYIANIVVMTYGEKEFMERKWFDTTVKLEFEGRFYNAPVGYHEILKKLYNDYMTLPPIEKRITHHSYEMWWKE